MRYSVYFGLICAFLSGQNLAAQDNRMDLFCQYLTGSYSSARQATKDTDYLDIRLHMYPIWKHRTDAKWFYVEQALASKQDKPYRQRVYRITLSEKKRIQSTIYTLPVPARFIESWKNDSLWVHFTPDSLTEREGCDVLLKKSGMSFCGGTNGKHCASEIRGAAYATSLIRLRKNQLTSWDRGFNAQNEQVWGAKKSGYRFEKIRR